ncbi:MAG: PilW family protein [Deltaproteobacteria bacterium]|jgi:type IV pilus assembly protein PilW|nr:PilW family protein [Deltaproteobacteria bacterium]
MVQTSFYKNLSMKSGLKKNESGVTLIELLIVMLISSIILGAIFTISSNHQKSYLANDRLTEMQQNLRAAIIIMSREIREAGCDPTGLADAGIILATQGRLQFTKDMDNNGDTDGTSEEIAFGFSNTNDSGANGIADGGGADWSTPADLGRDVGSGFQPIAENIEAVEFNYILSDDTTTTTPSSSQLNDIRAVQISILARASSREQNFPVTVTTYKTASGIDWSRPNDNYRRRFISVTIQCRNLGY